MNSSREIAVLFLIKKKRQRAESSLTQVTYKAIKNLPHKLLEINIQSAMHHAQHEIADLLKIIRTEEALGHRPQVLALQRALLSAVRKRNRLNGGRIK